MEAREKLKLLYQKYLNQTSTDDDLDEMFLLMKQVEDYEILTPLLQKEWQASKDSDEHSLLKRKRPSSPQNNRTLQLRKRWLIAASIALFVAAYSIFSVLSPNYNKYTTGFGETQTITLPDESKIILNANSTLQWNKNWEKKKLREVKLTGEAYFDVAHNDNIPFKVITKDLSINVTGTTFNVKNDSSTTKVALTSGKVNIELHPNVKSLRPELAQNISLEPGDQLSYSAQFNELNQSEIKNTDHELTWKDGSLTFVNTELAVVFQRLEEIYGKTIVVEDTALLHKKVDVGLPYSDWSTIVGLLPFILDKKIIEENDQLIIKSD